MLVNILHFEISSLETVKQKRWMSGKLISFYSRLAVFKLPQALWEFIASDLSGLCEAYERRKHWNINALHHQISRKKHWPCVMTKYFYHFGKAHITSATIPTTWYEAMYIIIVSLPYLGSYPRVNKPLYEKSVIVLQSTNTTLDLLLH